MRQEPDKRPNRRLLYGLIALLGVAAIALFGVLIWLLRPQPAEVSPITAEKCPMKVTDAVYGYSTDPEDLLSQPLGVAFDDSGALWVSDTGHSRVLQFDAEGNLIRSLGEHEGPGQLASPYGLAIGGQRVYVADWTQRAVLIYSTDGRYVERIPAADQDLSVFGQYGFSPYDVHLNGAMIVVSSNNGLYFFDRSGHVQDSWTGTEKAGAFAFPDAFAIDPVSGNYYVADTLNRRIVALDGGGKTLWISGQRDENGEIVGFWQLPRSIVVGQDGLLYVTDTFRSQEKCSGEGHIVVLTQEGELVTEFGAAGRSETTLNFPEKMAVAPDGSFAIADRENNRVVRFTVGSPPPATNSELSKYEGSFIAPAD